jgi:Tol biopolymer transport system component
VRRTERARLIAWLVVALTSMLAVPSAEASFPGRNGMIAFTRDGPPFRAEDPRRVGAGTLWIVHSRSGRTRQLTRVPRRCGRRGWTWEDAEPSFSASGRLLVYHHSDECDPRTPDGFYVMRADGSGRRLIRRERSDEIPEFPVFSPTGRRLAFNEFLGNSYIVRVPQPGERPLGDCDAEFRRCRELFFPRYTEIVQPAWSSRGTLALTLSGVEGEGDTGHIGIARPRDRERQSVSRLVTRSRRDAMPDWSPKGDRLVFHRETFTGNRFEGNVLTASARGKHRRPRRLTDTRDAFFPVWSPNGRMIAYTRGELGPARHGTLWVMRAADGGAKRLVVRDVVPSRIGWAATTRR